jgi:hypothetical protein
MADCMYRIEKVFEKAGEGPLIPVGVWVYGDGRFVTNYTKTDLGEIQSKKRDLYLSRAKSWLFEDESPLSPGEIMAKLAYSMNSYEGMFSPVNKTDKYDSPEECADAVLLEILAAIEKDKHVANTSD